MSRYGGLISLVIASFAGLPPAARAAELSAAECRGLQKKLRPSPNELWRTIPWKISLLDAQKTAAQVKKPIFIWAMDGHPLGCT